MRKAAVICLLALLGLLILLRCRTYHEPLERDLAIYAVIGHEMLSGRRLYSDLFDHKPPAIYATYALGEIVAGRGPGALFVLNIAGNAAILLAFFLIGRWNKKPALGLWMAFLWTVVSGNLELQGNQPNTELFINACLLWIFALLNQPRSTFRRAMAIGLLAAIASLYKHVAAVPALLLIVGEAFLSGPGAREKRRAWNRAATAIAVMAAAWGSVLLYFFAGGRGHDFWEVVVIGNLHYARLESGGAASNAVIYFLRPAAIFVWAWVLGGIAPLITAILALAAAGLYFSRRSSDDHRWAMFLIYLVGTTIAIVLPQQYILHYFQLWLPPLIVGVGWIFSECGAAKRTVAIAVSVLLIWHEAPSYSLTADEWSRRKYGEIFIHARSLGGELNTLLSPTETFYNWGNEAPLYYYAEKRPPTGAISKSFMTRGPLAAALTDRALRDLAAAPPEVVVVTNPQDNQNAADHPMNRWIAANYAPFSKEPRRNEFLLLARRGGRLAKVDRR